MKTIINNWKITDSQLMQYVKCSFKSDEGGEYNHYKLIEMGLRNPDTRFTLILFVSMIILNL